MWVRTLTHGFRHHPMHAYMQLTFELYLCPANARVGRNQGPVRVLDTINRKEVQRCQKREKRLKTVRVRYLYCLHHLLAAATTINNATQSKVDASCVQDFGTYHSSSSLVDLLLLACPIFVKYTYWTLVPTYSGICWTPVKLIG